MYKKLKLVESAKLNEKLNFYEKNTFSKKILDAKTDEDIKKIVYEIKPYSEPTYTRCMEILNGDGSTQYKASQISDILYQLNESEKLTEDLDDEEIEDKAEENQENQEELEDTLDSEEDQEENPVEEESELDKELNELRDILVDLDLNLYQITDKEDLNNSIYIIGKVADESNDVLMLVDTKPEEVNSEEIPDEEPIINNVDIDDNINEAEDNSNDLEKAKKIIENCGFTIQDENVAYTRNETGWEIQQYTPEGEDWFVDIIVNNDVNKLIDEISSYAENFDIDEEVELYVDMRGQRGIPSSISALVEDAKWKKDQLTNLANELQKLKSGNINESAEVVSVLRNPENSNERVEINKLPNGKYQTLYYSDEKSFSGAQSQFDDLDSAIKQVQKLRPSYKLDEIDNNTYNDEDEAAYYRYKELYANSNLARHKEAMEKAAKACKEKGIKLREAEEIDLENDEESEEDEHKTELEQRFDFVKLPNSFEEVNKLNPRYGEELTPDHEAVVEYLMNCLIEMNPEAAEELQKEEEPEETPIEEPDYDVDLGIDIEGEEDLDSEDQY